MNWRFLSRKLHLNPATSPWCALGVAIWLACGPAAQAQLVAPASGASAPAEDPMERAKRQANNVMRWIKVHSDKPRANAAKPNEPAAAPAPAPAPPPRPAARTAAAPAPAYVPPPEVEKPVATAAPAADPTPQAPPPVAAPVAPPPTAAAAPAIAPAAPPPPEDDDEEPLKALSQPQPEIPRNIMSSINMGKVMVKFMVEPNGSVSNVEVVSSSSRLLNKPTIAAISTWRFEPIKTARPAQIEIGFNF